MSSRTSSRSTLTMVPSTMSPSLKYLIVESMAARKSSAEPMSLIATCVGAERVGASVVLAVKGLAPDTGWFVGHGCLVGQLRPMERGPGSTAGPGVPSGRSSGPARYETHGPSRAVQFTAHDYDTVNACGRLVGGQWAGAGVGHRRRLRRGESAGVGAGEPRMVGRRGRRLPGRTRRLPRERLAGRGLRLVS